MTRETTVDNNPALAHPRLSDPHMTPEEVAAFLRTSVQTLSNQRSLGVGLPWVKTPTGAILYRVSEVVEAITAGERGFTSPRVFGAINDFFAKEPATADRLREYIKKSVKA
jgi:hypothetical protein